MTRLTLIFTAQLLAGSAYAQLDPPPDNIDHSFTSAGGGSYILRNDDNSNNQGVDSDDVKFGDYYPNTKLFIDTLGVDRPGPSSVGNPRGYHQGYTQINTTPFGFLETDFNGGPRNIWFWDCANLAGDDCDNGAARANAIHMPAPTYRSKSNSCVRGILGHEMAHKWQRAYSEAGAPSGLGAWVTEGQARALQDKIYLDLDTDPEASCVATYLGQVNGYLAGNPSKNVPPDYNKPLWTLSYDAALFWTYLMEQIGLVTAEPVRGIDFLVIWWDEALAADDNADSMEITEAAIKTYYPDRSLLGEFRSFVLANLIKDMDLSTESEAFRLRYSYRDEEQEAPLEQNVYAEVGITDSATVTAGSEGQVSFFTDHFAAQYFSFDVSACPANHLITVDFDPISSAFGVSISKLGAWGVVTGRGGSQIADQQPGKFYKKVDEEWSVKFQQPANRYDNVYATTTGVQGPVLGELTVSCDPPQTLGPDFPLFSPQDPLTPGPAQTLTYGPIGPITLPPLLRGGTIKNLDPNEFQVQINGRDAQVTGGLSRDNGYELFIEHPAQDTPGPHELMVSVAGIETRVADAVYYRNPRDYRWVMVLMDQSLSMGNPSADPKLAAAVAASKDYLRHYDDGIDFRAGLIGYALDAQTRAPLVPFTGAAQATLEDALDNLTPLGPESAVGNAIDLARTSFASLAADEPAGRPAKKEILLFSDGPLSFGSSWDEVSADIIAAGITIHTIALGRTADQPLLARIARETGGTYRYLAEDPGLPNSGVDQVALAGAMARLGGGEDRQQIATASAPLLPAATAVLTFNVPQQTAAMLLPAVQAVREAPAAENLIDDVRLRDPSGQLVPVDFDGRVIALASQTTIPAGPWTLEVDTNTQASGELGLQVFAQLPQGPWLQTALSLPEVGDEVLVSFVVGSPIQFDGQTRRLGNASVVDSELLDGALMINDAGNQDNQVQMETVTLVVESLQRVSPKIRLAGKGSALPEEEVLLNFARVEFEPASGSPSGFTNEFGSGQRGSYNFEQRVDLTQAAANGQPAVAFQLIGHESAAVLDGLGANPPADTDVDGMPNRYEARYECLDAALSDGTDDADEDLLVNFQEFQQGTDPCDSDTDGGGELDGSELRGGRDPLFSRDDALRGAAAGMIVHEITHTVQQGGLVANAIRITLPGHSSYPNLTLKRGTVDGPLQVIAELTQAQIAQGVYFDRGLTAGQEYCYRLEPFDAEGNAGRPTRIFCRTASADPEVPWGDIVINDGAPRTSDPLLNLRLSMYNKDPASVSMRFGINGPPQGNGMAFSVNHQLQLPAVAVPTEVTISVGYFLTALGPQPPQEEELVARETITVMPPASTGAVALRLTLFNPDGTPVAAADRAEVMVQVCEQGQPLTHCKESTAYPAADGSVTCPDLRPGNYDVYAMGSSLNLVPIAATVTAGQTTNLGEVVMTVGELFKSGFEGVDPF